MTVEESDTSGAHDFDFIFGSWRIANQRLVDPTDPACTDWLQFATRSRAYPIFGGLAHLDLIDAGPEVPGGPWQGLTLRQFDPGANLWRIWWASSRRPGYVDPPLAGRFADGIGLFFGDDDLGGQPITVRFEWRHQSPGTARWQQEFSFDAGQTWNLNWIMEFTRVD